MQQAPKLSEIDAPLASESGHVRLLANIVVRSGNWRGSYTGETAGATAQQGLANAENDQRKYKRNDVIEKTEQQQPRQQVLFIELIKADQHRGVKNAEAAGSVAGKSQQRGG